MKTLIFGEQNSLPWVLKSLFKLRHGQITFRGLWNGTVGEQADLHVEVDVHDKQLFDLILKNGVLGAAEGYIRGYWHCEDLVGLIQLLSRNRHLLDKINQNVISQASQFLLKAWYKTRH